jgi:hypothetical protein
MLALIMKCDTGQVEYSQRIAWTTMGMIAAVLIPALILVGTVFALIQKKEGQPWALPMQSSGSAKLRAQDETSSGHKRRKYDAVYRTHEPLPGKPDIDFEDKDWDLGEQNSSPVLAISSGRRISDLDTQIAKQSDV